MVFKANDVAAVMHLLFRLLHLGGGIFECPQDFEKQVLKCLRA